MSFKTVLSQMNPIPAEEGGVKKVETFLKLSI
jgi:hypothetical protein